MTQEIALDQLLLPISEATPAGSDLRYTTFYEEIMEARRCEDAIAMGDWRHEVKSANWDKVISLSVTALGTKSKDLQIAVWLTEALTVVDGFQGLETGLRLVTGLVEGFWECVYPQGEDGDLEYRATPFQFLNEKVPSHVRQIPITDPGVPPGYAWFKWQQSREVGSEADTRNRYGEIDEEKKNRRDQRIAEGGLTAEEFDAAVKHSRGAFSRTLRDHVFRCQKSVQLLAEVLEEEFCGSSPSLAELAAVMEDCSSLVQRLYGDQLQSKATDGTVAVDPLTQPEAQETVSFTSEPEDITPAAVQELAASVSSLAGAGPALPESSLWGEALALLETGQLQDALAMLLYTGNSSESVRDRNRVRLLMGQLCLKAGRSDLARPIIEELHGVIEELQLERWESPLWIAEVLDAYYQCLQAGGPRECDVQLSQALFRRICSLDVTKAMPYRI